MPESAFPAEIQLQQGLSGVYRIDINGGTSLSFDAITHAGQAPSGSMQGGEGYQRIAPGHYRNVVGGATFTFIVNGDILEYRADTSPTNYIRLTLQRASTIGTTPPPGGGGGGGGCNAGFGLLALGLVVLPFFYKKRA